MRSCLACCITSWLVVNSHGLSMGLNSPGKHRFVPTTSNALASSQTVASSQVHDMVGRRKMFSQLASLCVLFGISGKSVRAVDLADAVQAIPFKEFTDPMFTIRLPKSYFAIRRTAKGDLPDSSTGKGRRGATIFTGGDMQKAELVAIERYPVRLLLEENGIEARGNLESFPDLGEPQAIANLISLYREKDRSGGGTNTALIPESITVTADGKDLMFQLKTEIDVQKPELLMEQYGVSKLIRITVAKASLRSNDGNLMVVFGSALEQDFKGADGQALMETIQSFQASDGRS